MAQEGEKEQKQPVSITEHLLTLEQLSETLKVKFNPQKPSSSEGLDSSSGEQRLLENGLNQLTPPKKTPKWLQFLKFLSHLFNVMLLVAGIACYVLYGIDTVGNAANVFISFNSGLYRRNSYRSCFY